MTGPGRERVVAAIALGSNLGDRERNLKRALSLIEKIAGVVLLRRSSWHETDPVGGPAGQGKYLNGAALLETTLAPRALLEALLEIEQRLGRDRSQEVPCGPRPIDLDLLWHGETRCEESGLRLPHPRLEERRFVLEPLSEIAPEAALPDSGRSVRQRLEELR